jgi:hypothetical protein
VLCCCQTQSKCIDEPGGSLRAHAQVHTQALPHAPTTCRRAPPVLGCHQQAGGVEGGC